MQYHHKDKRLIYFIAPILLTVGSGLFLLVVYSGEGVSCLTKLTAFVVFGVGILSLIAEIVRKNRVWEISNGIFATNNHRINLAQVKEVKCVGGDFTRFDIKLSNGRLVKFDPPFSCHAREELLKLLEKVAENNKMGTKGGPRGRP
jgi:hypothetical protein